jgi:hypothetical protein
MLAGIRAPAGNHDGMCRLGLSMQKADLAWTWKWVSVARGVPKDAPPTMTSSSAKFVAAVSAAKDADSGWKALEDLARQVVGHRLFTVMTTDVSAGLVRRAYSNMPEDYPASGTKPLHGNTGDWYETVFNRRQTFVANSIEDIAKVFPDHELIASLGCGSVVNIPIVLEDKLVAAINLLDEAGHYTPDRVAAAELELAIPARLCCALALRFEPLQ